MVCCIRSPGQRTATVFPYTTLFRSGRRARSERADHIISGLLTWPLAVTTLMALLVIALAEPLAQLLLAVEDDAASRAPSSEEHTSELQSRGDLVFRLLLVKNSAIYKVLLL